MSRKKIAIVTGASSGMGEEFVFQLPNICKTLDEIWVVARRKERINSLSEKSSVKTVPLVIDLQKDDDYNILSEKLNQEKPVIAVLVNSAGYGVHGYFEEQEQNDCLGMIELNCYALSKICHRCIPFMRANSRIINMASAAAFIPQKRFSVYAASKSYVLSFSRALNQELKRRKIYVTAVCPGPVNTEFFKKDNCDINKTFYKRVVMAEAKDVVKQALQDSVNKRELSIYGSLIKAFYVVTKIIPHRIILFILQFLL